AGPGISKAPAVFVSCRFGPCPDPGNRWKGGLTMWKKYAPALTGLSLLLALPALAADKPTPPGDGARRIFCCPLVSDYLKKTTLVEIQGKLQLVETDFFWEWKHRNEKRRFPPRFPMPQVPPRIRVWQITINGQPYDLNFGGDTELEKLAQK